MGAARLRLSVARYGCVEPTRSPLLFDSTTGRFASPRSILDTCSDTGPADENHELEPFACRSLPESEPFEKSCIAFLLCHIEGTSTAFDCESLVASRCEKQLFFSKLGQSAVRA